MTMDYKTGVMNNERDDALALEWPTIRSMGWAPETAASCVLSFIREPHTSQYAINGARVYFKELLALCENQRNTGHGHAIGVHTQLMGILTATERQLLE